MLTVALLLIDRLGTLVDALLLSRNPSLSFDLLVATFGCSQSLLITIVGGGVVGKWSSNSSECASLLVAIPESSRSPKTPHWLGIVESVLSVLTFLCFLWWRSAFRAITAVPMPTTSSTSLERLLSKKFILSLANCESSWVSHLSFPQIYKKLSSSCLCSPHEIEKRPQINFIASINTQLATSYSHVSIVLCKCEIIVDWQKREQEQNMK